MSTARLAGVFLGAALCLAGPSHSAVVPFADPMQNAPRVPTLAPAGANPAPGSHLDLVVDQAWADPAQAIVFFSAPASAFPAYPLPVDMDAPSVNGNTGSVGAWMRRSASQEGASPFYRYLLSAGEYALDVGTLSTDVQAPTAPSAVPLPGAIWLFGSALLAFVWISGRHRL